MKVIDYVKYKTSYYFALKFPYDGSVVERVRTHLGGIAMWVPEEKLWVTPLITLPILLLHFKDFTLTEPALKLFTRKKEQYKSAEASKLTDFEHVDKLPNGSTLWEHQKKGINFLYKNPESFLGDSMGLGKTNQVLSLFYYLIKVEKSVDRLFLICLTNVRKTWVDEAKKFFPDLTCEFLDGSIADKGKQLTNSTSEVIITNYESLMTVERQSLNATVKTTHTMLPVVEQFFKAHKVGVVFDESHRIKNPNGNVFKNLKKILPYTVRRHMLSGTMVSNKPVDAYGQFLLLDLGKSLGSKLTDFKRVFCVYSTLNRYEIIDYKNLALLKSLIKPAFLRRTAEECQALPELIKKTIRVPMSSSQRATYNSLRNRLKTSIDYAEENPDKYVPEIKSSIISLIQAACWEGFVDESHKTHTSNKILELDTLLADLTAEGRKVIVWSYFKQNGFFDYLLNRYKKYNPAALYGDLIKLEKDNSVEMFKTDPSVKILFATPQVGGVGLNLQVATAIIYLNRSFDSIMYDQSRKRNYRGGQTNSCLEVILESENSIDDGVEFSLTRKAAMSSFLHGDSDKLQTNKNEIVELFSKNLI